MNANLSNALEAVQVSYKEVVSISDDILTPIFKPIDEIVSEVSNNSYNLSIDSLRSYILRLQLKAYEISETKEKAAFTAEMAEAILKEKFAVTFNAKDGSAAAKEKLALVETSAETVAELLYTLVADRLKTKLDQIHRLVAALTSVLVSRGQEQKFMNVGTSSEIPPTTNGRTILNE